MKKDKEYLKRIRRLAKLNEKELETYYDQVRKSAHVFKDRSKFDKKKSRQEKQKGWSEE